MKNIQTEQVDGKNIKKATTYMSMGGTLISLALTYVELFPFYPGCIAVAILCMCIIINVLPFSSSYKYALHFLNTGFATAPIWTLVSDPCAIAFALS